MENTELYHHGSKGQKWGVRLYQNKDGSLTPLGRLRYQKNANRVASQRKKNLEKARAAKVEKKKTEEERKKQIEAGKIPVKKMTDDELKARVDRLDLEKKYNEAIKDIRSYDRGKRFVDKFTNSTIDKVAENVASDVVAQTLKALAVKGVNKMLGEEAVFTNNKKKN